MSPTEIETDDDLLLRMRSGDEQAFVSLYRRRQGAIYRFALHMSGSAAAAEDITQEVFLALLRDGCGTIRRAARSPGTCSESRANWYCDFWNEPART